MLLYGWSTASRSITLSSSFFFLMIRRPPRSTLFPTRRSSDLASAPFLFPAAASASASPDQQIGFLARQLEALRARGPARNRAARQPDVAQPARGRRGGLRRRRSDRPRNRRCDRDG